VLAACSFALPAALAVDAAAAARAPLPKAAAVAEPAGASRTEPADEPPADAATPRGDARPGMSETPVDSQAVAPAPPIALPPAGGLPEPVAAALRRAGVPPSATGFVVLPLSGTAGTTGTGGLAVNVNAATPLNPASTMKLVTTYAALSLLGPAYAWQTEALAGGPVDGEVLQGPLVLRGSGDPALVVEHLWLMVQRIRQQGIRTIVGDLVLDKSAFEAGSFETGTLDGDELRPYNVAPDALLLNYKAVTVTFVPDLDARRVYLVALPPLAGLRVPAQVRAVDGPCGDWRGRLQADFSDPRAPRFLGAYPLSCGERNWNLSLLSHDEFLAATFRALWEDSGGIWRGQVRTGPAPSTARRLALHESAPLADVIREINKYSNNVMTRQLYLTLGAAATHQPANPARSARAVRDWLGSRGLAMPELVMENGAGLSRVERISAGSMARLLAHAWGSPVMPELLSSLPVPGVDGTMKNRPVASGSAHVKTGLLADVRAVAGYVLAASGRRYVVVGFINHPHAGAALPAHDALLQWVYSRG